MDNNQTIQEVILDWIPVHLDQVPKTVQKLWTARQYIISYQQANGSSVPLVYAIVDIDEVIFQLSKPAYIIWNAKQP